MWALKGLLWNIPDKASWVFQEPFLEELGEVRHSPWHRISSGLREQGVSRLHPQLQIRPQDIGRVEVLPGLALQDTIAGLSVGSSASPPPDCSAGMRPQSPFRLEQ